jgi:hypothetical protein
MAELKNIKQLTKEAQQRDQPFINNINDELNNLIDQITSQEEEYKLLYNITTPLVSTSGPLQKQRIKNLIIDSLKSKGYKVKLIEDNNLEYLEITWTIATLNKLP